MGIVITGFSKKGGVGKSTLLFNVAAELGRQGKKVVIVDIDPQASIAEAVSYRNELIDAGAELPYLSVNHNIDTFKPLVIEYRKIYDFVIIDTQGADTLNTTKALSLSDIAFTPFQPSQVDVNTLPDIFESAENVAQMKSDAGGSLRLMAIMNRVSPHSLSREAGEMNRALADLFETSAFKMAKVRFTESKDFRESYATGKAVSELKPGSKAAAQIQLFINELVEV